MRKMQILEKRFSIISPKTSWTEMGATIETSRKVWVDNEIYVSDEECQKILESYKTQYKEKQYELSCIEPRLYIDWVVIEESEVEDDD
jgi:hypothetical protein